MIFSLCRAALTLLTACCVFAVPLAGPAESAAVGQTVSTEELLETIFQSLDLPTLARTPSLVPTAFEAASEWGIIDISTVSPAQPVTQGDAVYFAFLSMGWSHEAQLANWLCGDGTPPPAWTEQIRQGTLILAEQVKPAAPSELWENPDVLLTPQEAQKLAKWLGDCRQALIWDKKFSSPAGTLWLRRTGTGRPPAGWQVSLASFETYDEASSFLQKIQGRLPKNLRLSIIDGNPRYDVVTPKVASAAIAQAQAKQLPGSAVVPAATDSSIQTLFFAGWSPAKLSDTYVTTFQQLSNNRSLPLSEYGRITGSEAAINGGYFYMGQPIGTIFISGVPQNTAYPQRSMVAWKANGGTFFGSGDFRIQLQNGGRQVGVPRTINKETLPGELGFFSGELGRSVAMSSATRLFSLSKGKLRLLQSDPTTMKPTDWLLEDRSINGRLSEGDPITLNVQWRDENAQGTVGALQGGPLLLKDGKIQRMNEGIAVGVINRRHPRTLVGRIGKTVWWLAVDGRAPWHSSGLTLDEATTLGQYLGFTDLLNLDGGGSTELLYHGYPVNKPSDGRERKLPYAVCFGGTIPPQPVQMATDNPEEDVIEQLLNKLLSH